MIETMSMTATTAAAMHSPTALRVTNPSAPAMTSGAINSAADSAAAVPIVVIPSPNILRPQSCGASDSPDEQHERHHAIPQDPRDDHPCEHEVQDDVAIPDRCNWTLAHGWTP